MASMIKQVYMTRNDYGADKGLVTGTVTFSGERGEITIKIANDKADKFIALLADELVACAQETAEMMRVDVIDPAQAQLEHTA